MRVPWLLFPLLLQLPPPPPALFYKRSLSAGKVICIATAFSRMWQVVLCCCCPYLMVFNLALHTRCLSAALMIQNSPWGLMYKAWLVFIGFPEHSFILPSVAIQRHFCQLRLDSPQNPSTFRKGLGSLSSQFPYPFALCSGISV